jgi:hypothetical protein
METGRSPEFRDNAAVRDVLAEVERGGLAVLEK